MKHLNLYINAYTYYTFYYEIIKRGGQNFSTTIIHTHAEPIKLTFLCVPAGIYIIQYTIHLYTHTALAHTAYNTPLVRGRGAEVKDKHRR